MKINVSFAGTSDGRVYYFLRPSPKNATGMRALVGLMPRIERMARLQLGDSFISITEHPEEVRLLVKTGTSKGAHKFHLRNLLGWIALFAIETG